MRSDPTVAGIDLGCGSVRVAVGTLDRSGALSVRGVTEARSRGLREGAVSDLASLATCIQEAVERAEESSGVRIHRAALGVSSPSVEFRRMRGAVHLKDIESEIGHADVERALAQARAFSLPLDRQVLFSCPMGFLVDDQGGIKDPIGLYGNKLEVELGVALIPRSLIQNLLKCVQASGVSVEAVFPTGWAAASVALSEEERELGVALVDIGEELVDVWVLQDSSVLSAEVIPWGGERLTQQLSQDLGLSLRTADELKRRYGTLLLDPVGAEEGLVVKHGTGERRILRSSFVASLRTGWTQFFETLRSRFKEKHLSRRLQAGLVLTGGVSLLEGGIELAEQTLDRPCRLGYARSLSGPLKVLTQPGNTTALGLLHLASVQKLKGRSRPGGFWARRLFARAEQLYADYF